MLLSELTANALLKRLVPEATVRFCRFIAFEGRLGGLEPARRAIVAKRCNVGLPFEHIDRPEQLESDLVLYWGDFLHMRQYVDAVSGLLPGGMDAARRLLLLNGMSNDFLSRTVSCSTTLLFNAASDMLDPQYGALLRRLALGTRLMLVREGISASLLADLVGRGRDEFLGIDATQFITLFDDWRGVFGQDRNVTSQPGHSGLAFFARGQHHPGRIGAVLATLSGELDLHFGWLPWGDQIAFPYVGKTAELPLDLADPEDAPLEQLIARVANAKVVVTDTYHLAVIGWSLGVPVIMIPGALWQIDRDVNAGHWSARIDKRHTFYAQHNLLEFYLSTELISSRLRESVTRIAGLVRSGAIAQAHRRFVRARAIATEVRLRIALTEIM